MSEQIRLTATLTNDYVSKNTKADTFVYEVKCTPAQKARIKEIKGTHYRETEDGKPLFYTTDYVGDEIGLIITTNNNLVIDKSDIRKIKSLARQLGANVGQAMADQGMSRLMDKMFTQKKRVSADGSDAGQGEGNEHDPERENAEHEQTLNEM